MIRGLDQEWLQLIVQAKSLGLTVEELRDFFYGENGNNHNGSLFKVSQVSDYDGNKESSTCKLSMNNKKDLS